MWNEPFIQQGWQCPICRRVYSPSIAMCFSCGGERQTITTPYTVPRIDTIIKLVNKQVLKDDEYE